MPTKGLFDNYDERATRLASCRARFLSWRYGREVLVPFGDSHWWHKPLRFADTGEPLTVVSGYAD